MTGVDADLATPQDPSYEQMADWWLSGQLIAAPSDILRGLLTELARLREQRDDARHLIGVEWPHKLEAAEARCAELERERDEAWQDRNEYIDIAEREGARCARLQQALDETLKIARRVRGGDNVGEEWYAITEYADNVLREALAGPGSEQGSVTGSGIVRLPDIVRRPADPDDPYAYLDCTCDGGEEGCSYCSATPADSQEDKT